MTRTALASRSATTAASGPAVPAAPDGESPGHLDGPGSSHLDRFRWWGLAWFAVGMVVGCGRLGDNSFLTHLATGRLLLDGDLPHADPYSFTAHGAPWAVQSWLASRLYAGMESLAGLGLVRWATGVLVGLTLAGIWRLTSRRGGDHLLGRVAVVAVSAVIGLSWWNERPQMMGFALLVAALVVVTERRSRWWLLALFAVWVNAHGSWLVGLALVGLVSFALAGEAWAGWVFTIRRAAPPVVAASVGILVGALASPYGLDLVAFPFELTSRGRQLSFIAEWQRPELLAVDTVLVVALVTASVVACRRLKAWSWLPLVGVCALLSAYAVRNLATAAIALVPVAAGAFDGIGAVRTAAAPSWRRAVVPTAAVLGLGALGVSLTSPHLDLAPYPVDVVSRLEERGWIAEPSVRVAAVDWVGAYLELRHGDRANVFIDDRAEVFDPELYVDHRELLLGGARWHEDGALAPLLDSDQGWRQVERSGGFAAWCRLGGPAGC